MYPEIIERAYKDGHTIAAHTYSHKDLKNLSDEAILDEINRTNALIYNTIGIKNKYIRPPYGSLNDHILEISDMSFILWNIDSSDWKYKDANIVYKNIMDGAKDGGISLSHDLYGSSIDGTLKAIDELLAQGYTIISLEEAEALGYIDSNNNQSYYSVR
jgi:peptidoglycan/xylan/chitin deacetylase (PgdA/CDA1 family)